MKKLLLLSSIIYLLASCEREDYNTGNIGKPLTGELVTVNFTMMEEGASPNPETSPNPSLRRGEEEAPSGSPHRGEKETSPNPETPVIARNEAISFPPPVGGSWRGASLPSPYGGEPEGGFFLRATLQKDTSSVNLRASSSPLDEGKKVRVVAYEAPSFTVEAAYIDLKVSDGLLVPDGMPPMVIPSGLYNFVAYSFNESDTLPEHTGTIPAIGSYDLLWCETQETVNLSNNTVQLTMNHLFSQIELKASVDPAIGTRIESIEVARFYHSFPDLEVISGNLTENTPDTIPFAWIPGTAQTILSNKHTVYPEENPVSSGERYVTVLIDKVTITDESVNPPATTLYTAAAAGLSDPWSITYNSTQLEPGSDYTLLVTFVPLSVPLAEGRITTYTNVMYDFQRQTLEAYLTSGSATAWQWQWSIDATATEGSGAWHDINDTPNGSNSAFYTVPANFMYTTVGLNPSASTPNAQEVRFRCLMTTTNGTGTTPAAYQLSILFIRTTTSGYGTDPAGVRYLTLNRARHLGTGPSTIKYALLNLGQSNGNDAGDLGDFYQWGRIEDGHQHTVWSKNPSYVNQIDPLNGGPTYTSQSVAWASLNWTPEGQAPSSAVPQYGNFIYNPSGHYDWGDGATPSNRWGNGQVPSTRSNAPTYLTNGPARWTYPENNPCPAGWMVPSRYDVWDIFRGNGNNDPTNVNSAYNSPSNIHNQWSWRGVSSNTNAIGGVIITNSNGEMLFLPALSYRINSNGQFYPSFLGEYGQYWTSTDRDTSPSPPESYKLMFNNSWVYAGSSSMSRAYGASVRCVETNNPPPVVTSFSVRPHFDNNGAIASPGYNSFRVANEVNETLMFRAITTAPSGTNIQPAVWSIFASPANPAITVAGASNSVVGTTLNNDGTVTIPSGYVGTITVTVKDFEGNNATNITLYVNDLETTVSNTAAQSVAGFTSGSRQCHFIVDGRMWRVLSKTMGTTGHGSGSDVLILSEHLINDNVMWGTTAVYGYNASSIRQTTLKNLYDNELLWAHNFAVKPVSSHPGTWDTRGNDNARTGEYTVSTGTKVNVSANTFDGAFLLSSNDIIFNGSRFGFLNGTNADPARIGYRISDPGTGTPTNWWLRSPNGTGDSYTIKPDGEHLTFTTTNLWGLRPSLLLNFAPQVTGITVVRDDNGNNIPNGSNNINYPRNTSTGNSNTFTAKVSGINLVNPQVVWSVSVVSGNANPTITPQTSSESPATLHVPAAPASCTVRITATSVDDPTKTIWFEVNYNVFN